MITRSEILISSARLAGEGIRKTLPTEGVFHKESKQNIVTAADLASERIIMNQIRTNYPNDSILSEESAPNLSDSLSLDHLWVIDPLDGTNNFRYGRNFSCVSIACVEKGIVTAGVVYDPFRNELFYAEKNQGSYLNEHRLRVSNQTDLGKATIGTDNSYNPDDTKHLLGTLIQLNPMPWLLIQGCAILAMCEVASGKTDLYFHTSLKPWDNAAAFLLVEEAGGIVRDLNRERISFLSPNVIVGNQTLVDQFGTAIKKL